MSDYHWYVDNNATSHSMPGAPALGTCYRDQKKVAINLRAIQECGASLAGVFVHENLHIVAPNLTEQQVAEWTAKIMDFITPEQEQYLNDMCLELIYGPPMPQAQATYSPFNDQTMMGVVLGAGFVAVFFMFLMVLR